MRIPDDWEADRSSGYGEFHHLTHKPCGFRTHNAYDLVLDLPYGGRREALRVISVHECDEY